MKLVIIRRTKRVVRIYEFINVVNLSMLDITNE